ncbi:MAG: hypothetical protein RBS80_29685 [Thermoguttaceae bacterium]|jgi:hypothetical protein|nr:hypothetical protein [Thermoguttaceae bacterium]
MITPSSAITVLLSTLVAPVHADIALNITSFGGVADGKTDNAPAFRRAMQEGRAALSSPACTP